MIPHAFVSGTFYTAAGTVRANQTITFMPLSTPYAVDGELVLSLPQMVVLDSLGRIHDGSGNLYYRLAKGFYRVIASDTDAFFISVSDDQQVHDIESLASDVGGVPSTLRRVFVARDIFSATRDSMSVVRSLSGDPFSEHQRFMIFGETGDLTSDTTLAELMTDLGVEDVIVLGNANPGGAAGTIASKLTPWSAYIGSGVNQHFWYALGNEDWTPGNATAVTNYLTTPGARYYKQSFVADSGVAVAMFVVDSNALEPDGNTQSSVQGQWLQTQLGLAQERWKIVVFRDSPFVSVSGASSSAMDWPFAAWGAHAVVAAGAKVCERLTLAGGIPLFVNGCGGTGTKDVFGTPLANSNFRATDVRACLVLTALRDKLTFHFVNMASGSVLNEFIVLGPADLPLSFTVNFSWDSGFCINRTNAGLELEPYGLANKEYTESDAIKRIMDGESGQIVRMTTVPTVNDATASPFLKNCLIAVGDDPVTFYWWNKAVGDFVEPRFLTFDAVSYYNGSRSQLAAPTFTPNGGNAYGTIIDHVDNTVSIYVSENGGPFSLFTNWPTEKRWLFQAPRPGQPVFLAAFARKAGSIDSELLYAAFNPR